MQKVYVLFAVTEKISTDHIDINKMNDHNNQEKYIEEITCGFTANFYVKEKDIIKIFRNKEDADRLHRELLNEWEEDDYYNFHLTGLWDYLNDDDFIFKCSFDIEESELCLT